MTFIWEFYQIVLTARAAGGIITLMSSIPLSTIQDSCPDVFGSRQRVAQVVPADKRTGSELPGFLESLAAERREKAAELVAQAAQLESAAAVFRKEASQITPVTPEE